MRGLEAALAAAGQGDEAAVRAWLDSGGQIDSCHDGVTLLTAAAGGGHEQLVATLLECGADMDRQENRGQTTALMAAALGNQHLVASRLLRAGANLNLRCAEGKTALQYAMERRTTEYHTECVEVFRDHLITVTADQQEAAMSAAGMQLMLVNVPPGMRPGDPMVVRTPTGQDYMAVIPQGVGPVSQFQTILPRSGGTTSGVAAAIGGGDGDGQPHPAVPAGHHVMLVDVPPNHHPGDKVVVRTPFGPDYMVVIPEGAGPNMPFHIAVPTGGGVANAPPLHESCSSDLLPDEVLDAAFHGDEAAVQAWIDAGGRINAPLQRWNSSTLLIAAATYGHDRLVDLLIRRGAELDHQNSYGSTALIAASTYKHQSGATIVRLLLLAGADTAVADNDGRTALQWAKECGQAECVLAFDEHAEAEAARHADALLAEEGAEEAERNKESKKAKKNRKKKGKGGRGGAAAPSQEPEVAEEEAVELAAALEDSMRLDNQAKGAPKEQGAPSSSAEVAPALKEEEPPADFICPITTEVMAEPVMAADGHSYERRQIERWLTTKSTSPLTGGELEHLFLTPNHSLRRMIREWQEAQR